VTRIAIIGAGVSGRLLALNLRRQASAGVSIQMIDRREQRYMGPAYSDDADYLLLNVPAGRMGAFVDDPEHFLKWAQCKGIRADAFQFLPRGLYRNYVLDLFQNLQRSQADGPRFEHLRGNVSDVEAGSDGATIHVEGAASLAADKVVLALGNFLPRDPPIRCRSALTSGRYVRNPWSPDVLARVSHNDAVILIGTGQTTIDLALALDRRGHKGRLVAISRRGLLPLAHRGFESYPSFFAEIEGATSLLNIFRVVRRHFARAESIGIDARAVIDSLRPDTQTLWMHLPVVEKRRFMRHLFRYWEIIRSRIPPENEAFVQAMRASGRLDVVAGRICDLVDVGEAIEVHYTPRHDRRIVVERARVVINCIGPETDYDRVDDPLVKRLVARGLARPGPANIGFDVLPHGLVIGRDGVPSRVLHTLGSSMRGVLWEVLAVPDIRLQAELLARHLLDDVAKAQGRTAWNASESWRP
jgi:uncharacterized NAD(P)/FAD-binding protein YdhS